MRPLTLLLALAVAAGPATRIAAQQQTPQKKEAAAPQAQPPLTGTAALDPATGDERSVALVAGIDRAVMREIQEAATKREALWQRDLSSPEAYDKSVEPNRQRLRKILGVLEEDKRKPLSGLEYVATTDRGSQVAEAQGYVVHVVRWPVLQGVNGEGILIKQRGEPKARVVLLPDAGQTPEEVAGLIKGQEALGQCAHELALAGCDVVIPALINRETEFSGNDAIGIKAELPHREYIYRQAFEMGRHVLGYELQKVLSLVEWMSGRGNTPVAVVGYGEGGLLALYAGALDTRVDATVVCGAFENRDDAWTQPIYRNVQGLLREFGDAEIASLVLPRQLIIAYGSYPEVPTVTGTKVAPGGLVTPSTKEVRGEVDRARKLTQGKFDRSLRFVVAEEEAEGKDTPYPTIATGWLLKTLKLTAKGEPSPLRFSRHPLPEDKERQERQVREMERYTQRLLQVCEDERTATFWRKLPLTPMEKYQEAAKPHREHFWNDVIGRNPDPSVPANARSRFLYANEKFTAYEVMLEVWPEVQAWGYLLVPKGIKKGEKRPVVVCQHGLEGLPEDVVNEDQNSKAWKPYKGFAANLARQGYITFSPHNFYRGQDNFRVVQRKLNLMGKTLFTVIIGQHQRILEWLATQPNVDASRIAFYGLSYGGKSAMRIPAALDGYCLSICSGDFNEWIRKNITTDHRASYLFNREYEIFEWNLGRTFNYAEMAALIAPRPFMVERGHDDGVAIDEWVAWEYAKVQRHYVKLGIADKAEIEYFNGPHCINGVGTYAFLRKHLKWPANGKK
ncbi:alpha/beta hydrolase family protein [Roseimicrobium gellanilyticum]|uniref:Alpha/beta hydrolase family protein n=1 Tax=Roseimicrobium gellanilyticum TaxID=748857 RepID=A0A366H0V7_9BACT|nr:alpha/beta hydrolase family protein [Roseimicrobium gellanilyticum]RBP35127.1 alpha/beta hydrolase family protein [Roseimicrobium gellanilyticum]